MADDLMGGWDQRYDYEFTLRLGPGAFPYPTSKPRPKWLKDFWLIGRPVGAARPPRSDWSARRFYGGCTGLRTFRSSALLARSAIS